MTTISEVAARANVSVATVSRVLNGNASVDESLADRVRSAIDELDYRPSRIARSMRTQRTMTVAVIVPDIENPFFTSVVRGIEAEGRATGLLTVLCNSDNDLAEELAYLRLAVDQRMDGVILATSGARPADFHGAGLPAVPTVLVDREIPGLDVDAVLVDNVLGARSATTHLLEAGAERVACVTGPLSATTSRQRLDGYLEALARAGRSGDDSLIVEGDFRVDGGRTAVAQLMRRRSGRPDALLVCNNQMTMGALQELSDCGIAIPDDVMLVGFDDEPWARYWRPPVTTIAQPSRDVGSTAMRLLSERLANPKAPTRHVQLTPALTVRASSSR